MRFLRYKEDKERALCSYKMIDATRSEGENRMGGMGSFWVGTSGLQTSQNAINVTANNLANLDTTGYVRQQVLQSDRNYRTTSTSPAIANTQVGLGVTIAEVVHTRDMFLDKYYRTETGRQAFYNTLSTTVGEVQDIFQELEGQQFEAVLTDFQEAFSELAKAPGDSVNQNLVIQKATSFISRAQAVMTSLTEYQENLNQQVGDMVNTINGMGEDIVELNKQIAKIEAGGTETAYDLRDQRDSILDELSQYVKIDYKELDNGTITVTVEGTEFVEGARYNQLQATAEGTSGYVTPTWSHLSNYDTGSLKYLYSNLTREISTDRNTDVGQMKALLLSRGDGTANYLDGISDELSALGIDMDSMAESSVLMTVQAQLDTLVHSMVTEINNIFSPLTELEADVTYTDANGDTQTLKAGTLIWDEENGAVGSDGEGPGRELFTRLFTDRYTEVEGDDGNTYYVYNEEDYTDSTTLYTLSNLKVNADLTQDGTLLPYTYATDDVAQQMGEQLESLWNTKIDSLGGKTFVGYYSSIISDVADAGNVYEGMASTLTTTVASITNKRDEIIGVSSDEELSNMIRYQSAYNAASRYINVVDQMLETLVTSL